MTTPEELLQMLRELPDKLEPLMGGFDLGILPCIRITLNDVDKYGDITLVCGFESGDAKKMEFEIKDE